MLFEIRPISQADRAWIKEFILARWGSAIVVSRGQIHRPERLPGLVAVQQGRRAGLITYHLAGEQCEIVTVDSLAEGQGIGSALIEAVGQLAQRAGCSRLWLITTNDNLAALGFYQKRGFSLVQLHPNAVERSRQLKPDIPMVGQHGIPIRDEIELELE